MSKRRIVETIENVDMYEVPGDEPGEKDVEIILRGYSFSKRVPSKIKKRSKRNSKKSKSRRVKSKTRSRKIKRKRLSRKIKRSR